MTIAALRSRASSARRTSRNRRIQKQSRRTVHPPRSCWVYFCGSVLKRSRVTRRAHELAVRVDCRGLGKTEVAFQFCSSLARKRTYTAWRASALLGDVGGDHGCGYGVENELNDMHVHRQEGIAGPRMQ